MKRETSISRRSLLVGTACAALGALTGCTAPEPTAAEPQPELILRYAENQPEDYPPPRLRWPLPRWWPSGRMAG